jgi:hypothetical protein
MENRMKKARMGGIDGLSMSSVEQPKFSVSPIPSASLTTVVNVRPRLEHFTVLMILFLPEMFRVKLQTSHHVVNVY